MGNDAPGLNRRAGDRLPFIPLFSASATVDYYLPLAKGWNAHAGAGFRYVGESKSEVESSPNAYRLDNYGALDHISNKNWTIRVFET